MSTLFHDTRATSAEATAAFMAKLSGTYTRTAIVAVEVEIEAVEEATAEQLANTGKDRTYIDEDGVERVARSGKWLESL